MSESENKWQAGGIVLTSYIVPVISPFSGLIKSTVSFLNLCRAPAKPHLGEIFSQFVMKSFSQVFIFIFLVASQQVVFANQDHPTLPEAARIRDSVSLKAMLDAGTDPDVRGDFDTPALHWVVRYDDMDSARLLLNAGADPNISSRYGVTPISLAVNNGSPAMVKLLLDAGANPDTREHSGETMLMTAAGVGVMDTVRYLVEAGAEIDTRDAYYG